MTMVFLIVALSISLTDEEQLLVELINRARSDPEAEAAHFGINLNDGLQPGTISSKSKPPLAPHPALFRAAGAHSQDMLDNNYFSHTDLWGQSPTDRAKAAGYTGWVGENIAWGGSDRPIDQEVHVYLRHKQLFRSHKHRENILSPRYREVGVGIRFGVPGDIRQNVSMVTEVFGNRGGYPFITGVVYADVIVEDGFYSIGEGAADISIFAVAKDSGASYTVTTGPSGGYSLQVPSGTYTVTASDSISSMVIDDVVVDGQNVKVDFEASVQESPSNTPLNSVIQIVDDGDIGYTICGSWIGSGSDGFGADSLFAEGRSGNRVTWTFQVTPGRYRVSATWPYHPNGATSAPFEIRDGSHKLAAVSINQERAANGFSDAGTQWTDLGDSYDIAGPVLVVQLSGSRTGCVVADAIRVERLGDREPKRFRRGTIIRLLEKLK
jgi:hypothetical protein